MTLALVGGLLAGCIISSLATYLLYRYDLATEKQR